MLVAFDPPDKTMAKRRTSLAAESDEALAERLVALAISLREESALHAAIAHAASLPLGETIASPFALRAVALGVEVGATTLHQELRRRPDWPSIFGVADEVRDPDHGVWDRGVLKTGKYQGFLADEPFASFDPAHGSKWGPHELLHRAARFFHRRDASRWEIYLGARLNELVPVVVWYGPEQVMRLDEGAFDRAAAGRSPRALVADARWITDDPKALRARARACAPILRAGLVHFERELAAIDEELQRGMRVRVEHPFLDASSDATAYAVGHAERLEEVGAVIEGLLPDHLHFRDVRAYRDFVEALFDRLLFAPIALDPDRSAARRDGRTVWDLVHRAAHFGEDVDGLLDDARRDIAAAEEGTRVDLARWRVRIGALEPRALEDGIGPAFDQLADGIESFAPCARAMFDDDRISAFARSEALWERAPLPHRMLAFLERTDPAREMIVLEDAIAHARRDDAIERLCTSELPDDLDEGWIVRSGAFERLAFDHDVVERHAAFQDGEDRPLTSAPSAWLVGGWYETVSVVPCPRAITVLWDHLTERRRPRELAELVDRELGDEIPEDWPQDGESWLRELLAAGALGWTPA